MRDIRELTFEEFRDLKFPGVVADNQYPTLRSIEIIRKHYGCLQNLSYIKWGICFIQDTTAIAYIKKLSEIPSNLKEVLPQVRQFLINTNWYLIQQIMDESVKDFSRWMKESSRESLMAIVSSHLKYELGNQVSLYVSSGTRIEQPGDIFRYFVSAGEVDN